MLSPTMLHCLMLFRLVLCRVIQVLKLRKVSGVLQRTSTLLMCAGAA
jgi:hypothetical protein